MTPTEAARHVRLVRDGDVTEAPDGDPTTVKTDRVIIFEDGTLAALMAVKGDRVASVPTSLPPPQPLASPKKRSWKRWANPASSQISPPRPKLWVSLKQK